MLKLTAPATPLDNAHHGGSFAFWDALVKQLEKL
jgi:hypothetical protein